VTQLLFSLSLIAQSVAPAWQRHPAEGQARIARLLELSQAAHRELRLLLTQLSPFTEHSDAAGPMEPRALERVLQQGLPGALRSHIAEVSDAGIRFSLRTNGYRRQASDMEEALYRVGQEAINNAVKHAGARNVGVAIRATHRGVSLSVRDDGCGFDLAVAGKKMHEGHFGLPIMRQRITALGGTLEIVTEPGKGTRLGARLPTRIGQT